MERDHLVGRTRHHPDECRIRGIFDEYGVIPTLARRRDHGRCDPACPDGPPACLRQQRNDVRAVASVSLTTRAGLRASIPLVQCLLAVMQQIDQDIAYIKEIKSINPDTEIIIYVYSPVATEGSEMYEAVKKTGFHFPENLDDWLAPAWQNFDLRKNPLTPWLTSEMIDKILGFETVLNAQYPTVSDFRLTPIKRKALRIMSALRYKNNFFRFPYELKILQRLWRYRQPEIEGFVME